MYTLLRAQPRRLLTTVYLDVSGEYQDTHLALGRVQRQRVVYELRTLHCPLMIVYRPLIKATVYDCTLCTPPPH